MIGLFFSLNLTGFSQVSEDLQESFEKRIIAKGLKDPWSLVFGPDGHLWITVSKGYQVLRINPSSGTSEMLLDLNSERKFPRYDNLPDSLQEGKPWPQGGLMGLALHPDLLEGKPFVYLAYVYEYEGKDRPGEGRDPEDQGFHFKTKIVRYTYHQNERTLLEPLVICDTIPGSNDHNGGRLLVSKVEGKNYLFYSVGDMGAGQYENAARTNHAQDKDRYEGKILRFHVEPVSGEGWIPKDNPFHNAVWSLGHRNAQGLASAVYKGQEVLYASEHGPFSDDEINLINKGGNYGHPLVIGYADGNYDGLSAGVTDRDSLPGPWNTTYPLIVSEKQNAQRLTSYHNPIYSFYPHSQSTIRQIAETIRSGAKESPEWESIAPSGITSYTAEAIPGWKNTLLVTSLKQGSLYRLKLNPTGEEVLETKEYFKGNVRYRDVAVSSDGMKIYLITDKSTVTSGPTEENPESTEEQGAIIEYAYVK